MVSARSVLPLTRDHWRECAVKRFDILVLLDKAPKRIGEGVLLGSLSFGDSVNDTSKCIVVWINTALEGLLTPFTLAALLMPHDISLEALIRLLCLNYSDEYEHITLIVDMQKHIFNFLLVCGVPPEFHGEIWRRYVIQFGAPSNADEATWKNVSGLCNELYLETGLSVKRMTDVSEFNPARFSTAFGSPGDIPREDMNAWYSLGIPSVYFGFLFAVKRKNAKFDVRSLSEYLRKPVTSDSFVTDLAEHSDEICEQPVALQAVCDAINRCVDFALTSGRESRQSIMARKGRLGELIEYYMNRATARPLCAPKRECFNGIPFILQEDSGLNGAMSYIVASAEEVKNLTTHCYSEVFLEGLPVTVLNVDIDKAVKLPCPYSVKEMCETAAHEFLSLLKAVIGDIHPSLISLAQSSLGEIAIYCREEAMRTGKLSLRVVWWPPLECCFKDINEAGDFVRRLAEKCVVRGNFFVNSGKESAIDAMPYRKRKSCRLPNMHKNVGGEMHRFAFVCSYNASIGVQRNYFSPAIGLSRQPVDLFRPSISGEMRVYAVEKFTTAENLSCLPFTGIVSVPQVDECLIEDLARHLNVTFGWVTVESRFDSYVTLNPGNPRNARCPIHLRQHRHANCSIFLRYKTAIPCCFSSHPPKAGVGKYFAIFKDENNTFQIREKTKR